MLMRRYNMQYFNTLPLSLGVKLIYKTLEETNRQQAWDMWVQCYPHMDGKNFIPFKKFYNPEEIVKKPYKSAKELLKIADSINIKVKAGEYKQVNYKE
jgi:hypothetical protein